MRDAAAKRGTYFTTIRRRRNSPARGIACGGSPCARWRPTRRCCLSAAAFRARQRRCRISRRTWRSITSAGSASRPRMSAFSRSSNADSARCSIGRGGCPGATTWSRPCITGSWRSCPTVARISHRNSCGKSGPGTHLDVVDHVLDAGNAHRNDWPRLRLGGDRGDLDPAWKVRLRLVILPHVDGVPIELLHARDGTHLLLEIVVDRLVVEQAGDQQALLVDFGRGLDAPAIMASTLTTITLSLAMSLVERASMARSISVLIAVSRRRPEAV